MKKKNLLILGVSGGVANAVLQKFLPDRNLIGKLVFIDKDNGIIKNKYIDHKKLSYVFIKRAIKLPEDNKYYRGILKKYKIDIVLDITDDNSIPLIDMTDKMGISVINTGMNYDNVSVGAAMLEFLGKRNCFKNAPHIICTGMNPGVVNMWVRYGIEKFGIPKQVIHFEYDSSRIVGKSKPMITWSRKQFIEEFVNDAAAVMLGRNKLKEYKGEAINYRKNLRPILKPILNIKKYYEGVVMAHEECVSIAQKYDIPSQFIYAIESRSLNALLEIFKRKKKILVTDLILGDNTKEILEGSDNIGVLLEYPKKKVYYLNSVSNSEVLGKNATCSQVAVGILAGLFTLLSGKLKPGAYFTEDLFNTSYKKYIFDNLLTREWVFNKTKGKLKLVKYIPKVEI
ncbi:MAG: hypothetical protein PHP03_02250 [Candidatus Pacebacteria bacterium]|nr:hypothetical protein [Candidatus Paceibacterota bacterium]